MPTRITDVADTPFNFGKFFKFCLRPEESSRGKALQIGTMPSFADNKISRSTYLGICADLPIRPRTHKKNAGAIAPALLERFGDNLLSRKLYNHYHRQCCV